MISSTPNQQQVPAQRSSGIIFPESALAHQLLDGLFGLEIGAAAHNPFGLNTHNVGLTREMDADDHEFYKQSQINMCGRFAPIDIPGDAANIPVADSSVDFVVSSHVWEHLADPLRALEEWGRVVRHGGYIMAIVPKRDADLRDVARPITPMHVSLLNYYLRATFDDRAIREFGIIEKRNVLHFTVFSPETLRHFAIWFNARHTTQLSEVVFLESDDKVGNGHLICWQVIKPAST